MPLQLVIVHLCHDDGREVDVRLNVTEEFHQSPQQRQRIGQALDWLGFENPEPWLIVSWESTDEWTVRVDMRIAALARRGIFVSFGCLPGGQFSTHASDGGSSGQPLVASAYYPTGGFEPVGTTEPASVEDAIDKVIHAAETYVERRDGAK